MCYIDIILRRAIRPPHRVRAVRDELAVGVEERIGPQAGGQDVGACLGDFELFGPQVEVLVHEQLNRLIDREAVGRAALLCRCPAVRASHKAAGALPEAAALAR